jgi:hypothetical protein
LDINSQRVGCNQGKYRSDLCFFDEFLEESIKSSSIYEADQDVDNLWFLAQDYLAHVHNLSVNRQLNWKIPEQVSRGGHPTYPIS